MTAADEAMLKDAQEVITDCLPFAYLSVGCEFQEDAIKKLEALRERINVRRKDTIAARSESEANLAWIAGRYVEGMIEYMTMWIHLKKDEMEAAWNALVTAQERIETALRLRPNDSFARLNHNLYAIEQLLFPPSIFVSSGLKVERFDCSICGSEYGECDHLAMNLYMGKMCYKVAEGEVYLDHVSFVTDPQDKRLRAPKLDRNNGSCSLTYRPRPMPESQGEEPTALPERSAIPSLD